LYEAESLISVLVVYLFFNDMLLSLLTSAIALRYSIELDGAIIDKSKQRLARQTLHPSSSFDR